MSSDHHFRDHYLPPDPREFLEADPKTGRIIVIAPTRAACETIEVALGLALETLLQREHGEEIRELAGSRKGFGVVAGTGTGKTLSIRPMAEEILRAPLKVGVVNREREATPETPSWNVVIVTTGIARRWFQGGLITSRDTLVVDEIHQTSAELELCLALGKRVGCRFIWLSATVDPSFYASYLDSAAVLETTAFDPAKAARVEVRRHTPAEFLSDRFLRHVISEGRGVAVFLPTRAEVEALAEQVGGRWKNLNAAFYHGGEPIRVIRPYLDGEVSKPFLLALTAAGQSAVNLQGLDTVIIYDARYTNLVIHGRNVLSREYLGANEILQMAGRVHGRVESGEVYILSDRDVVFEALEPTPPEFQLAGDSERVALTSAAIGVDLGELDLPVPLDKRAYRRAVERLTDRGIIEDGRLTEYGQDVEAMPVDRPWGELLVRADLEDLPVLAVISNVDSLYRMTRDEPDLRGLVVPGSDHLTAYNIYQEAVTLFGSLGRVHGLERHLFSEELEEWAEGRGIMVKTIEDMAIGMASVYRTLELPLPKTLARAKSRNLGRFQRLLVEVMPFDLVVDGETSWGESVRVSRESMCNRFAPVAGQISYFADRFGRPRGAIEGTNLPLKLLKQHASAGDPMVEYDPRRDGLLITRQLSYGGFELERTKQPLGGDFPAELREQARKALVDALLAGQTNHPDQSQVRRALNRLGEYWRRSGGTLTEASSERIRAKLERQVQSVTSMEEFRESDLALDPEGLVSDDERRELDSLPSSVSLLGDKVPLDYEIEDGQAVVRLRLKQGQARRLKERDLPKTDRPLRFTVVRGRRPAFRADSLADLRDLVKSLSDRRGRRRRHHR